MAKGGRKSAVHHTDNTPQHAETSLSILRQDTDLWYRICVLLHDLSTIYKDPSAEMRLSFTEHELYISAPYFSESDAAKVRTTKIQNTVEAAATEGQSAYSSQETLLSSCKKITVEEAIHNRLANFFDKRRASGDSRPCGPHDMVPIYLNVFGIGKHELRNERFLSRLRRSGPGDLKSQ